MYTNNLPVHSGVTLSLYVDDAMYHSSSANLGHATGLVPHQLAILPDWRVAVDPEKSEVIAFSCQIISRYQPLSLNGLNGITWKWSVKYFGVTLNQHLSFTVHVSQCLQKARGVKAKLFSFISNQRDVYKRQLLT